MIQNNEPNIMQVKKYNLYFAVFLFLSAIEILLHFSLFPRYQSFDVDGFSNVNFVTEKSGWRLLEGKGRATFSDGTVTLHNVHRSSSTMILRSIPKPGEGEFFQVSVDMRIDHVLGSEHPHQRARVYLVGVDQQGRQIWNKHHTIALIDGSSGWQGFIEEIPKNDMATSFVLGVGLTRASGTMQVRNISIQMVAEDPVFSMIANILLAGLVAGLVGAAVIFLTSVVTRTGKITFLVSGSIILAGVLSPAYFKESISAFINQHLQSVLTVMTGNEESYLWFVQSLDIHFHLLPAKLGHFGVFAIVSALAFILVRRRAWAETFSWLLLIAGITEILQFYTVDRQPRLEDWGVDALGILLGAGIGSLIGRAWIKDD